jgi:hypothetical protein
MPVTLPPRSGPDSRSIMLPPPSAGNAKFPRMPLGFYNPKLSAFACDCKNATSRSPHPWPACAYRTARRADARPLATRTKFLSRRYPSNCPFGSLTLACHTCASVNAGVIGCHLAGLKGSHFHWRLGAVVPVFHGRAPSGGAPRPQPGWRCDTPWEGPVVNGGERLWRERDASVTAIRLFSLPRSQDRRFRSAAARPPRDFWHDGGTLSA